MSYKTIKGTVTKFKGNGRKLGYPTANLTTETDLQDGVYFGYADLAEYKLSPALIFVGVPTTMGDMVRRVEVHLLDIPDVDYYGQNLEVEAVQFHRKNYTFESVDKLLETMHNDERIARTWFEEQAYA